MRETARVQLHSSLLQYKFAGMPTNTRGTRHASQIVNTTPRREPMTKTRNPALALWLAPIGSPFASNSATDVETAV